MSKESFLGEYPRGKESDYYTKNYAVQDKLLHDYKKPCNERYRVLIREQLINGLAIRRSNCQNGWYPIGSFLF